MTKLKIAIITAFLLIVPALYLWRINQVPPALLDDEASIGYNAALIAKTLHDQNRRFLPVYTLTLNGSDWKQPVNIYTNAVIFKLFGPSAFKLKLTSFLFAFISAIFVFLTLQKFKLTHNKGQTQLRLIRPMQITKGCLKCHGHQESYLDSTTAGGVSVIVPMKGIYEETLQSFKSTLIIYIVFLLIII